MSSSATRQSSARNRFATANPMPRAAPVTSATFCGEGAMSFAASFRGEPAPRSDRLVEQAHHKTEITDRSSRRLVLDGSDDGGEHGTGNATPGHLADDAADIRCRGRIGKQRKQHAED